MDQTIQLASFDHTLWAEKIQHTKDYKSQSLVTQAGRGEDIVPMLPATRKGFFNGG